jgi:acyl-CoA synthetase (AMP-forming)/AMP-acid ligase II
MEFDRLSVPTLLRSFAGRTRDLLVCDSERLTYAEAEARSRAVAKGLLALGAGKSTRVALLFPNGADYVVHWLGITRIGAIAMPISTMSTAHELGWLLAHSDAEFVFAAPSYRAQDFRALLASVVQAEDLSQPLMTPRVPSLRRIFFAGDALSSCDDALLAAMEDAVFPSDRLTIVHTSGSTSAPKGVIHAHGPLLRHMVRLNEIRAFTAADVLFSNSPFFWIGGLAYSLVATMLAGATLVCSNSQMAAETLALLEREKPTMGNGFALGVRHLAQDPSFARRDLSSMTRGNLYPLMPAHLRPADPELRHALLGMTEAGSVCLLHADEGEQPEHRRGSFGHIAPAYEGRVVDPDTGRDCANGQLGEFWLRGEPLMEGYYGRERQDTFTPDGWYRTGDMMIRNDEGLYFFKGRRGDMIKTAGANVSPREVEAALREVAGIDECLVIGVDDPERGQVVVAVIPGSQKPVDEKAVRARLAERLSVYKVPRRIIHYGRQPLPMLSSGKVDLNRLREQVKEQIGGR